MMLTLGYSADLVPEIADDIVNIDRAMRWGFGWKKGPFELIDLIGAQKVIDVIKGKGLATPKMLALLQQHKAGSFYRNDGTEFLGVDGNWHTVS